MKQTALTYLIDKLELKVLSQHMPFVDNIISEALEMERQQIAQAYQQGEWNQGCNGDAEDYLKQTFEDESNA
jgi:hypothetical protein